MEINNLFSFVIIFKDDFKKLVEKMKKQLNSGLALIGHGTQLALSMIIGVVFGQWLDEKYDTSPLLLIISSLVFFTSSMIFFIKSVSRINKKIKKEKDVK